LIALSRSASLSGYARVMTGLGHDPHAFLRATGLPPSCLSEPDLKIPTTAVSQLLELTAERAGIPDLGLRMAEVRAFSNLGAVGLIMREQPDVRAAVAAMAEQIWAQAGGLRLEFEEEDGIAILTTRIATNGVGSTRQGMELSVAVTMIALRRFLGPDWRPEMILFRHSKPANLARHLSVFGCAPLFRQERDAVVLLSSDLDTPIPDADPVSAGQLTRFLAFTAGSRDASFAARVHEMINLLLPRGACQVDQVARHFGIDRRTVHRRLLREGTSFEAMVQQSRRELGQAYLAAGDRSLTEVADLLGFSCLSAFSRWRKIHAVGDAALDDTARTKIARNQPP
jgi:AraC-like DNA-binding protein